MFLKEDITQRKFLKWLLYSVVIFFILLIIVLSAYLVFENKYYNKIYPNIYLGDINLGGKTIVEVEKIINEKNNSLDKEGIEFYYNEKKIALMPVVSSFSGDIAYQIIKINDNKTGENVYKLGRKNNFILNLFDKISFIKNKKEVELDYFVNENEVKKILHENYKDFETVAINAKLVIDMEDEDDLHISIEEEKLGKVIDYEKAVKELEYNLSRLNFSAIKLGSKTDYPEIYKDDCLNVETKTEAILSHTPLVLTYEDESWEIEKEDLADWLTLEKNNYEKVAIVFDEEKISKFLTTEIDPKIRQEPVESRFQMENGRVVEFEVGQDGLEIDIAKTIKKIELNIVSASEIELEVKTIKTVNDSETVDNMGIKEIIGTGHSSFAGSPDNRRHNIKTGSNSVNGLLIKPSEEFSLVKNLGEIDEANGYLPELVIKGNETVPEYGGGLCQVATTLFRAALNSGLEITARQSHSYRVSYYEPAGTDAAVYDPWPDIRFVNNTENYILIQMRMSGDDLYYDFWGVKDDRIVEVGYPVIYNITEPSPTKIIETLDLPVGEKKCTEHAHDGADAYFDYTVTFPSATSTELIVQEKRFSSHYIPWQEVCLIGVEELSSETASSTVDSVGEETGSSTVSSENSITN